MVMRMRELMKRRDNQKGFTLVELIVVMAILAVLAGIAVPKFSGILEQSKVKADGATAASIINAARIHETNTGTAVAAGDLTAALLAPEMDAIPAIQSKGGAKWAITGGGADPYEVTFTTDGSVYAASQKVTEGAKWTPTPKGAGGGADD